MSGKRIDLSSEPERHPPDRRQASEPRRPFLGVHFACCEVYSRVYTNREQSAYEGNCPRCGRKIRFRIGPGGTAARFFRAE